MDLGQWLIGIVWMAAFLVLASNYVGKIHDDPKKMARSNTVGFTAFLVFFGIMWWLA